MYTFKTFLTLILFLGFLTTNSYTCEEELSEMPPVFRALIFDNEITGEEVLSQNAYVKYPSRYSVRKFYKVRVGTYRFLGRTDREIKFRYVVSLETPNNFDQSEFLNIKMKIKNLIEDKGLEVRERMNNKPRRSVSFFIPLSIRELQDIQENGIISLSDIWRKHSGLEKSSVKKLYSFLTELKSITEQLKN